MLIEPDIIPPSSNEGKDASRLLPDWRLIILALSLLMLFFFLLKAIVPLILMLIGIAFIFRQYKTLNSK